MADDDVTNVWYDEQGRPHLTIAPGAPVGQAAPIQQGLPVAPPDLSFDIFAPQQPITPGFASKAYDILTGSNGQERYQLFPERIVRSALSLPTDVMSGKVQTAVSGGNQPLSSDTGPEDELLQRVQDMAALMGGGGVGMAPKATIGTAGAKLIQPAAEEAIAPTFHSAVENAVNTSTLKSANPEQWLGTIKNAKGVKPEELDWTGLKDWLGEQQGPVSKEQVQGYLEQNKVGLGEVNKGEMKFNTASKYNLPQVKNAIKEAGENPGELSLTLANDGDAYRALTKKFPELAEDEDWAEKVANDLWGGDTKPKDSTKYSKYQLPGGTSYREKLLTLPPAPEKTNLIARRSQINQRLSDIQDHFDSLHGGNTPAVLKARKELAEEQQKLTAEYNQLPDKIAAASTEYKSSHWDEPNILAHIRMNDRTVEGKAALHIEEIQSDIHQSGREQGYKITPTQKKQLEVIDNKLTSGLSEGDIGNPDMKAVLKTAVDKKVITQEEANNYKDWSKGENSTIPNMPFKKTWLDLALKRVIREAAESGKDRISWTPGEAQAARYDLSKSIDELHYNKTKGIVTAYNKGAAVLSEHATPEKLPDIIGKEATKKLFDEGKEVTKDSIDKSYESYRLKGQQLKIGGEGMHYFYDKMLPAAMEKLTGQKMKVGKIEVNRGYPGKFQLVDNQSHHVKDFDTREEAIRWQQENLSGQGRIKEMKAIPAITQPINYIDLPQSVKDIALHKGFPLFSSGLMLSPVEDDPFTRSKFKLTPVKEVPKFK